MLKYYKGKIDNILDAPDIRLEDGDMAGDILLNFFKDLGWNPDMNMLDPTKVRTTKSVFNRIYDAIYELAPDALSVGFLMVNNGPGTEENIPENKVYLLEGWLSPLEVE